jgi:hypothetical protein
MSIVMIERVLADAAAKGAAWQVLVVLASHASDDGTGAYPSVQTLVAKTNLTHRAVRRALAGLEREGYVRRVGKSKYDTVNYTLTPESWPAKPEPVSERASAKCRTDVPTDGQVSDPESDTSERGSAASDRESAPVGLTVSQTVLEQPPSQPSFQPPPQPPRGGSSPPKETRRERAAREEAELEQARKHRQHLLGCVRAHLHQEIAPEDLPSSVDTYLRRFSIKHPEVELGADVAAYAEAVAKWAGWTRQEIAA